MPGFPYDYVSSRELYVENSFTEESWRRRCAGQRALNLILFAFLCRSDARVLGELREPRRQDP